MASAVEADLSQLNMLFSLRRRMGAAIDTREIAREIAARLREELDYEREAKVARLYANMLADRPEVRVPRVFPELSTKRLLTLEWLDGAKLLEFEAGSSESRTHIATHLGGVRGASDDLARNLHVVNRRSRRGASLLGTGWTSS